MVLEENLGVRDCRGGAPILGRRVRRHPGTVDLIRVAGRIRRRPAGSLVGARRLPDLERAAKCGADISPEDAVRPDRPR